MILLRIFISLYLILEIHFYEFAKKKLSAKKYFLGKPLIHYTYVLCMYVFNIYYMYLDTFRFDDGQSLKEKYIL